MNEKTEFTMPAEYNYTRQRYLHKLNPALENAFDMAMCMLVRLVFVFEGAFCIYFLVTFNQNYFYLFLIAGLLVICLDSIFIMVKRKGKEHFW